DRQRPATGGAKETVSRQCGSVLQPALTIHKPEAPARARPSGVGFMWAALERYFDIKGRGSSVGRELRGAVATFLTMAYILVANPAILKQAQVPQESAVACTALAAGLCCLLMGLWANFPIALASGMGLNAVVAYQVAEASGSWQIAMGVVVLDGVVVFVFVLSGLREAMLQAIPLDLRRAIGAGIGLFIAFIGTVNARLVVTTGKPLPDPPVTFGSLAHPEAAVAAAGLLVMAVAPSPGGPRGLAPGIPVRTRPG